jgi:hypothetical protein
MLRLALTRSHCDPFSLPPPYPPARSLAPTIMAPNLAVAQCQQIHAMLQAGRFTADQIAKVAGCSNQSVSVIRSNIRAFDNPRALFTASSGRSRSIASMTFDALEGLLPAKPELPWYSTLKDCSFGLPLFSGSHKRADDSLRQARAHYWKATVPLLVS